MIICFEGQQGQGKTSSAILVSFLFSQAFKLPIVSNTEIRNVKQISTLQEFKDLRNSIFLLDEAYQNFDSRRFSKNIDLTYEIMQQRKRHNIFIYTCQMIEMVDNRLREQTHYLVRCRQSGDTQKWIIYDYMEFFYRKEVLPINKTFSLSLFKDLGVFSAYDTYASILPLR